jgi:hypothetical protein
MPFIAALRANRKFICGPEVRLWEARTAERRSRPISVKPVSGQLPVCRKYTAQLAQEALQNGVTRDEIIEMITHLAFYSGWPTANTALSIARKFSRKQSETGSQLLSPHQGVEECRTSS